jgi:hypothetical protein
MKLFLLKFKDKTEFCQIKMLPFIALHTIRQTLENTKIEIL